MARVVGAIAPVAGLNAVFAVQGTTGVLVFGVTVVVLVAFAMVLGTRFVT